MLEEELRRVGGRLRVRVRVSVSVRVRVRVSMAEKIAVSTCWSTYDHQTEPSTNSVLAQY